MGKILVFLGGLLLGSGVGAIGGIIIIKEKARSIAQKYRALSNKHLQLFRMMNEWVRIKQEGKSIEEFIIKKGYNKIAIYGVSYAGITLYNELKKSGVCVKYFIDKNVEMNVTELQCFSPQDTLEDVDAIIVTAISFYQDIKTALKDKINCPIVSLEDILYEL